MTSRVLIYGKERCPYTRQAREAYGERAVFLDVLQDPDSLAAMLAHSGGVRRVPVIVEDGQVRIGFGKGA